MKADYREKPVLKMTGIEKEFSGVYALSGITFDLYKGEIHCLVGENGAGKSTLMKMIAGWVQPDSGEIEIGQTVKLGYFSQENEAMDDSLRVIDYIKEAAEYVKTPEGSISASQMLERFLFPPLCAVHGNRKAVWRRETAALSSAHSDGGP